jgi:large subunit ribosomal protein L16
MMSPKKTKFRKAFKGRIRGNATSGNYLAYGSFGLKATSPERITARQIEAARRAITRHMKRQGRLWIRIFPDVPVSTKPLGARFGGGKGSPEFWVARVKPGKIMFELDGVPRQIAEEAFDLASAKLPIKTRFVERD